MNPATYRRSNPAETELERRVVAQIGPNADPEALEIFLELVRKIQRKARGTRIEQKITLFLDGYSLDAFLQVDHTVRARREALKLAGRVLTLSKYDEKRCELQELKVRIADKPLVPGHPGSIFMMPVDAAGEAMATKMGYRTRPMSTGMYGSFVEVGHTGPRTRAAYIAANAPREGEPDLVLIGCSKCKQEGKHHAQDLYTGDYWDKKRTYARASKRPWAILSAKHHLLPADKVIESYDKGMPGVGSSKSDSWGQTTAGQIIRLLHTMRCPLKGAVVEIHAGKLYIAPIRKKLEDAGITVRTPMKGMGIGRQKKWYNDQERAGQEGELVADAAGCIKTPATRLKSCSIQEWVDNLAKIMGRKTTSKRDDTVRAHYRALTRAMIEGATEVANIRAALKPLRKWSMIQATDAEKQLRSQQIGWLATRELELAPPSVAELAPQAPLELTIPPGLELDTGVVYYIAYHTPTTHSYVTPRYIEVTGYELRDLPGYKDPGVFVDFKRWTPRGGFDASHNTITAGRRVDSPQWAGFVKAATATRFESLAEIPATPAYQATRTLAGGWDVHDGEGQLVGRGTWPDWSSGPRNALMKGPTPSFHTAPAKDWKLLGFYLDEAGAEKAAKEWPGLQTFEINLAFPIFEREPKVTPIEPELELEIPPVDRVEVVESLEEAAPELTIEASTEGGIVLSGDTRKWKDAIKAIRYPRFRFSRQIPGWYVQGTRGKAISRQKVAAAAGALRSAGATVFVSYGEELSYAERQELAAARSEERVERLEAAAEKAQAKAEAAYKSGRAIGDHIPMGQPILVGHHSERRHRRDIERIGRAMDKTVEQTKKAAELTRRADAAEARQERLEDPGAIFRKLEKLRAELRRWQSILAGKNTATGYKIPEPEYAERVQSYAAEAEEKIAYWEAELENAGGLDVAAETVQPGDRISGRHITNAVILAVNKKSYRVESPANSIPFSMSQYEYKIELERAAGHKSAGSDLKRNQELARAYTNLATIYEPLAESFEGVKYGGDKYSKSLVRKAKSYRGKAARHTKTAGKLAAAAAAYAAREEKEWRPAPEVPDADPQRAQLEERIAVLADDIDVRARSSMPIPGLLVARLERLRAELAQLQTAQAEPPPPPATPERTAMQRASALVRAATGTGPSERSEDFAAWFLPRSIDGGRAIRELMRQIEIELGGAVHATMHKVNGDMTLTLRRNRRWVAPDPNAPPPGGSAEGASIALNWSEELEILQQIPTGWSGRGYTPEQGREFAPLREAMHPAKETGRITLTSDEAILLARALWKAQTILESKIMAYGEGLGRRSHPKRNLEIRLEGVMAVFDRLRKAAKLRMPEDGWPDIPMHERIENPGYPVDEAKRRVMVSLAPDVRKAGWTGPGLGGYCYVASEALAELADEPLTPYRTVHEGSSHWFVRDRRGKVIDLTASQFKTPVPYERAAATPWLEPAPRPQSGMLIRRARRSNPDLTAPAERELAAWTPSLFGTVELERGPAPWAWRLSLVEPDGRRIRAVDVDESGRRTFYTREEQLASPEAELAWSRAPTGAYYAAANAVDLVRLLKVAGEDVPWELLAYLPDEKRRGLKGRLTRELAGTREDMYQSVMSDDQPEISRSHAKTAFLSDAIAQTGKRRKNPAIEPPAQFATLPGMQGCECNDCKAGRACCGDATRVTAGGAVRRANPPDYTPRQISDLAATARSSGAVGPNAVVPRLVGELAADGDSILDYGAGPLELHAKRLRKRGHRVSVYEVGAGRGPTHDPRALSHTYDIVYASNVINIQPDGPSVRGVLDDLAKASRGGLAVVNYPVNPRKPGVQPATVERWLRERFATVSNVGTPSSPVWIAEGARRTKASPAKRRSNPEDKWIAESVKRPGRIHRHFGIPEDQPIPMARINTEIATLKAKRAREGRYTKAELSLLRALYLARRLKGYARDRDESITTDEERARGHNPRVDNPITAMTLAQLAPVLAQLMLGPRVMNPTELDEQPYSQLPPRALFVRRAPVKEDELELYAKIDDATARAVIGLQRGCNCKMSATDSVITTHRRINRLPRRRRR